MSVDELLKAVDDLNETDVEQLLDRVLFVRARRKGNVLTTEETALMQEINRGLPTELNDRYENLLDKRDEETITDPEYTELLSISEQIENLGVKRIEALSKLAAIRQVPLPQLMQDMGIPSPGVR
jgi:hypothetical protein